MAGYWQGSPGPNQLHEKYQLSNATFDSLIRKQVMFGAGGKRVMEFKNSFFDSREKHGWRGQEFWVHELE